MSPRLFFSRRWLPATLLVFLALAVLVRLGIWQLDRLEWRRGLNARIRENQAADVLVLDAASLDQDLYAMEYRHVRVTGRYMSEDEIVLRNQVWEDEFGTQLGVKLYTPLLIEGSQRAILVERGWIPEADAARPERDKYTVPGALTLAGVLRRAETDFAFNLRPDPTLAPGEERLDAWNRLDLERIDAQIDVDLLPVYLQRQPDIAQAGPPYARDLVYELGEGPHLGYAIQWFLFAAVLALGYPVYVQRQEIDNHTNE